MALLLGGSHYLLSVYRLHGIILTSIISLTDLSATLWLFVVVTGKCFVGLESPIALNSFPRFTSRFISIGLLGFLRMNFNQLVDETFTEAWERYQALMTDLPTAGMADWVLLWVVTRS
jgi:hypothetical protein